MDGTLIGVLNLKVYITPVDAEKDTWRLYTNTGLQTSEYPNKWAAMQDYYRGSIQWEREHV